MPRFSVVRGLAVNCLLRPSKIEGLAGGKVTSCVTKVSDVIHAIFVEGTFVPVSYLLIRSRICLPIFATL